MSQFVFILSPLGRIKVQVGGRGRHVTARVSRERGRERKREKERERERERAVVRVWGKLKMSTKKKMKKKVEDSERRKADCRGTFFGAKGQFIFVCYINFLVRLLSSPRRPLNPACLLSTPLGNIASLRLRSTLVSSLKTVNSGRHQGECELAGLSYSRR